MTTPWIPFYSSLREGDKRGLPRAVRFIYLELAMIARPFDGRLPLAKGFKSDVDAIHDAIGGNRKEIERALAVLTVPLDPESDTDAPLISLAGPRERRVLTINAFQTWVKADKSTPRVRKFRNNRREENPGVTQSGNAFHVVSETVGGRDRETPQRREEKRREEERREPPNPHGGSVPRGRIVETGTAGMMEVADAFVDAVSQAKGSPFAADHRDSDRKYLAAAINGPLRGDGTITGAIAAMREAVAAWVEDLRDKPGVTAGWSPRKFLDWLNEREIPASDEPAYTAPEQSETRVVKPLTDADREHMRSRMAEIRGALTGKFVG